MNKISLGWRYILISISIYTEEEEEEEEEEETIEQAGKEA
jgi:hypothetical protein